MVQKSGWIFTTNQQTQNDMCHIRQTTHGIVSRIYRSLLQKEYVPLLKMKMRKKNALKTGKHIARTKIP